MSGGRVHREIKGFRSIFKTGRCRHLPQNLVKYLQLYIAESLCEKIDFHVVPKEGGQAVLYIGGKPPDDQPSTPVLPPITPDKLTPRERYLRACQFYSGALLLTAEAMPKNFHPVYF